MLVEVDHAPSVDEMPPHISMHMLGCTGLLNATAARTTTGEGVAPSRRLQQAAAAAGVPSVDVLNMSTAMPEVVFVTTNGTGDVLAAQVSLAVPPELAGPSDRYWLITAPEAAAIGAPSSTNRQHRLHT
jgi:hypothetical protein